MADPQPFNDDKLRYSVEDCLKILGVSRRHFYQRVNAGVYATIKDGRRRFMTRDQLLEAANVNDDSKNPPA